jgi:hypothetical protein
MKFPIADLRYNLRHKLNICSYQHKVNPTSHQSQVYFTNFINNKQIGFFVTYFQTKLIILLEKESVVITWECKGISEYEMEVRGKPNSVLSQFV